MKCRLLCKLVPYIRNRSLSLVPLGKARSQRVNTYAVYAEVYISVVEALEEEGGTWREGMTGKFESGFRKEGVAVSTSLSLSLPLSPSFSFVTFAESRVVFTSANNERCTRNFLSLFPFHLFFIHLPRSIRPARPPPTLPPMISRAPATLRALSRPLAH